MKASYSGSWSPRYGERRGENIARVLRLAIRLSKRGMTRREAVTELDDYRTEDTKSRMFYRDIVTLEKAGIPVYVDEENDGQYKSSRYRVDPHFMRRFL